MATPGIANAIQAMKRAEQDEATAPAAPASEPSANPRPPPAVYPKV